MNHNLNLNLEINPPSVDLHAISSLLDSVGMRTREIESLRIALTNSSTTVVMRYNNGRVVGFGRMIDDSVYYGAVWDVAVDQAYQRKGIGTIIVNAIVQQASERGLYMVGLFTGVHNKSFYEKIGFHFHQDYHAMTKILEPKTL
jgi:ribosomal protein S18 acetylase RimI-like enzyme